MQINCKKEGKYLAHTWSECIGAGRACEGLRTEWQRQLKEVVKDCGFKYIRFHGLLAEDMFPVNVKNGVIQYNWYYIDQVYDCLLETGIRPIVELGFMPPALASGTATCFWWKANITPPEDFEQWEEMIYQLVKHFVERYGLEEVSNWYFEVWNEPNLLGFWTGTKSEYFHLYEVSVEAVKAVSEKLRVGGPATSNYVPDDRFDYEKEDTSKHKTHLVEDINELEWRGVWIEEFLAFCEKKNLPVDFVSTHPYPTDFALDGQNISRGKTRKVDSLYEDIEWLRAVIQKSAYPDVEIHLTEWSSSPTSRDYSHDSLPEAAYIIKSNIRCSGMMNSLSYWVFTDIFEEAGGGPEPFHGGFGLINMHGIKKPSYYAYKFLNSLGDRELERNSNYIVTKNQDGKVQILFYHYPDEMTNTIPIVTYGNIDPIDKVRNMGQPKTIELVLENLEPNAEFCMEVLHDKNTPLTVWRDMGMPNNLTKKEEMLLKSLEPDKYKVVADDQGEAKISIELKPWDVALLHQI